MTCTSLCCRSQPVAVIDIEATGPNATTDRIVEISVRLCDEQFTEQVHYATLVNPGCGTGPVHIHHITRTMLRNAPRFEGIAEHIRRLCQGRIIVGHNIAADLNYLSWEMSRAGMPQLQTGSVCTYQAVRSWPGGPRYKSLSDVALQLGVGMFTAHTAAADTEATTAVLTRLITIAKEQGWHLPPVRYTRGWHPQPVLINPAGAPCVSR